MPSGVLGLALLAAVGTAVDLHLDDVRLTAVRGTAAEAEADVVGPDGRTFTLHPGDLLADGSVEAVGPTFLRLAAAQSSSSTQPAVLLRFSLPEPVPELAWARETVGFPDGPRLPDGSPDYGAVLNALQRDKLAPETNAATPLYEAVCCDELLKRLGPYAPSGSRFRSGRRNAAGLRQHLEDLLGRGRGPGLPRELERAFAEELAGLQGPWTEPEAPLVAEWLRLNEAALGQVRAAVERPRYWVPLPEGTSLAAAPVPSLLELREVGEALRARALLGLGRGDVAAASADCLLGLRLAQRVNQGVSLLERLIAGVLRASATESVAALAAAPTPTAAERDALRRALETLPPFSSPAELYARHERYGTLALALELRRLGLERGPGAWRALLEPGASFDVPRGFYDLPLAAVDWEEVLRHVNRSYDLLSVSLTAPELSERARAAAELAKEADLRAEAVRTFESASWRQRLQAVIGRMSGRAEWDPGSRLTVTRVVERVVVPLAALRRLQALWNESEAEFRLAVAALGLSGLGQEKGAPAHALGEAVPTYLAPDSVRPDRGGGYVMRYAPLAPRDGAPSLLLTAVPEAPGVSGLRAFCWDGRRLARLDARRPLREDGCANVREPAPLGLEELLAQVERTVSAAEVAAGRLEEVQDVLDAARRKSALVRTAVPPRPGVASFLEGLRERGRKAGVEVRGGAWAVEDHAIAKRIRLDVELRGPEGAVRELAAGAQASRLAQWRLTPTADGATAGEVIIFAVPDLPVADLAPCEKLAGGRSVLLCCQARRELPATFADRVGAFVSRDTHARLEAGCARLQELQAVLGPLDELEAVQRDNELRLSIRSADLPGAGP